MNQTKKNYLNSLENGLEEKSGIVYLSFKPPRANDNVAINLSPELF